MALVCEKSQSYTKYELLKITPNGYNIINIIIMLDEIIKKIVQEEVSKQLAQINHEKPEPVNEKLLTAEEACDYLRCSRPTLHRWKKEGIVPHVRIGANIRYRESDLREISN